MSFGETILRKYGWTQGKQKLYIFFFCSKTYNLNTNYFGFCTTTRFLTIRFYKTYSGYDVVCCVITLVLVHLLAFCLSVRISVRSLD